MLCFISFPSTTYNCEALSGTVAGGGDKLVGLADLDTVADEGQQVGLGNLELLHVDGVGLKSLHHGRESGLLLLLDLDVQSNSAGQNLRLSASGGVIRGRGRGRLGSLAGGQGGEGKDNSVGLHFCGLLLFTDYW